MMFQIKKENSEEKIVGYLYRSNPVIGPNHFMQIQNLNSLDLGDTIYINDLKNDNKLYCVGLLEVQSNVCYAKIKDNNETVYIVKKYE